MQKAKTVERYIKAAAPGARAKLTRIRSIIRKAAPDATEKISYGMPYYSLNGRLAYFASFKNHISIFIMSGRVKKKFAKELAPYFSGRATLRFPLSEKLPVHLIQKIVSEQAKENRANSK